MNPNRGKCHVCDSEIVAMPAGDRDAYKLHCPACSPRLQVVRGLTGEIAELAYAMNNHLSEAQHVVVSGNAGRSQHTQEIHAQALEVARINLERIAVQCRAALAALKADA